MEFRKYQSIKRLGSQETQGLFDGECSIFPKIDGTNSSIWPSIISIGAGSRTRDLTLKHHGGYLDNAGFNNWVQQQEWIKYFFDEFPTMRLYGEWLVPHTIKGYGDKAWRQFYVFDVVDESLTVNELIHYVPHKLYKPVLENAGFNVIDPIYVGMVTPEIIRECLAKNHYLMDDPDAVGEGIVIKRYDFVNRYGRTVWAKAIGEEFATKHRSSKATKVSDITVEQKMIEEFLTKPMCEKVLAKIKLETGGFEGHQFPRLLSTVYYDFVNEEIWDAVKKFKFPTVNFRHLQAASYAQTKKLLVGEI